MKLANGVGSVFKKSGKRRHPWVARKTVGWNEKGQPKYLYIGYYSTRTEALAALFRYNEHPFEKGNDQYTLEEVWEKWTREKFDTISPSNINGYKAAYALAEELHGMRMEEIKLDHLQDVCDRSGKNMPTLKKFKTLMNQLFDYAVKHEYVTASRREVVGYLDVKRYGNPKKYDRTPFSTEEIAALWNAQEDEYIMTVLILIYTGLRIGELLDLRKADVHLDERWLDIKHAKTEAGIREVPIADKILPLIKHWMDKDGDLLIGQTYDNYYNIYWKKMCPSHKPHDTRHTCVSLLTTAGVDPRVIRSIVGHKGVTITENTYTHLDLPVKLEAINKI